MKNTSKTKRADTNLSANTNLREALEHMSDGFCVTDRNWTITFMNRMAANMLGELQPEEYTGKNLWACFPQAVGNRFYTEYHRAAAENVPVLIEEYYPPLNIWFEVKVYPNANSLSFYIRDITQRKQVEKELLLSNERFTLVAKATSEAIWDWDIESGKVTWGEGFTSIFGYSPDALEPTIATITACIHPGDKDRILESIHTILSGTANHWVNEFRFRKADNTYAYILDKAFIIRDEHHHALRMVGAIQDIHAQRKQEKRLEFIAKATSELIWERDMDSEEVFLNTGKLKDITGYTIEGSFITRSFWLEKIHPDDIPALAENREEAIRSGLDFYLNEYRFRKADGTWAHLKNRTYVIRDFDGRPVSLLGAAEDITQQRSFENTLIRNEKEYRQLFNNAPLPTIIFDLETLAILAANQAMIDQYGYPQAELLGKPVMDLHPKEEHERVARSTLSAMSFTRNDLGVFQHLKKNRERLLVEVSATLISYKGTTVMLATANDITEKVKLQQQLIEHKVNHQKRITKSPSRRRKKNEAKLARTFTTT